EGAARRGSVERLARFPGGLPRSALALAVAAGEVDARRVAEDELVRPLGGDVHPLRADRDDELALELQIGGAGRVRHPGAVADDGVGGLLEEERVVALVALLHLPDVVDVVAPDAVDRKS